MLKEKLTFYVNVYAFPDIAHKFCEFRPVLSQFSDWALGMNFYKAASVHKRRSRRDKKVN